MNTSKRFKLNLVDLKKIGVGALIAIIGAALTYGSEIITEVDFGVYTPMVMASWSVLVNIVRKFLLDYSEE